MNRFDAISNELISLIHHWETKLDNLSEETITLNRNSQHRNIKQIVGHMVDSASNNTHRIIHLQYQNNPINFPDYANLGNNDRWIAIQNYEKADWKNLIQLWKYTNLHVAHIILHVDESKLQHVWISALNQEVTLEEMITDYPRHFKLHLQEITDLTYN